MPEIITQIAIETRIFLIRGKKVMLDKDLAELYEVPTKALNQAVKRNIERFPEEFMFKLSLDEKNELVTNCDRFALWKHSAVTPNAFTEYGVAMLSSVLNSKKAAEMNVQIIRAFIRLRTILTDNADLRKAILNIERRLNTHDQQIQVAFAALKGLLQSKPAMVPAPVGTKEYTPDERKKMGFGKGTKKEGLGRRQGIKAGKRSLVSSRNRKEEIKS